MFKINPNPVFTIGVPILVPADGGTREETLTVTYRALASSEIDKFNLRDPEDTAAFLRTVIKDVQDIADADGNPLKYSPDVLALLIDLPWVRQGLCAAYFAGVAKAKLGN